MEHFHFKKIGKRLAFNSANADPIFVILQETKDGYIYFQESKPFGPVQFTWKSAVKDDEVKKVNDTKEKATKDK